MRRSCCITSSVLDELLLLLMASRETEAMIMEVVSPTLELVEY